MIYSYAVKETNVWKSYEVFLISWILLWNSICTGEKSLNPDQSHPIPKWY